jgi:stage II sporulation protein D
VAEVVAAEMLPGTPEEALRAQAVVARSFLLAQGPRHADADVCDLAHCQVLRGRGVPAAHRARARAAAEATAGRVLVLASGAVAETPFHAACGGHTADPSEVFRSEGTGAAAVADTGCPARSWEARVPLATFRRALGPLFRAPGGVRDLDPASLEPIPGGYLARMVERGTGAAASGDAMARALDRALGWGAVRSARFAFHLEGDAVRVRGSGVGHGLGLCQAGAARRAALGETYQKILADYFPLATLR